MAKRIEAQEVIQPDLFKNTIASAHEAEASLKSFSGELGRVIKLQAEIANSTKRNAKGYQELAAAEERSKIALTEKEKIDNRILTIQKQLTSVTKLQRDRLAELTAEQQRRNKVAKQEAILANENINAYDKLQVKIKMLSDRYRGLIAAEGKETAQSKLLRKEILALNAVRDKSNEALGMHQNKVGQYERGLNKLTSTLASLGLAFGVFSLLRNTLGIMSDFEKATASLSAITGATGGELESLKGTILDLATEMKVGVTETTKLFEIVGSQMPQLLKDADGLRTVSESSIILSKASGESIESSTLAMAAVMNQFSLEATEANRVMNVLAAGSLVGSAGISDVSEAMKNFGSVAAGANITVEESVALIEVLGKFGVVGAESGTKLRGSILKLQQASFGYASGQFEVNDALTEAKTKMDSLGSALEQDAFLQKTFGAENIATGRILLSNIDLFEEYTKGVTGTNVATEQAAINSDTMATVVKELKAAWENLVIKWSDGTDVLGGLKTVLRFIADNLETIIGWVVRAVTAWGAYRLALLAVNKEGTGFIQVLGNMIKGLASADKSLKSVKISFASWVGIAAALVPFLWDATKAIYEMVSGTTALDKITDKYNNKIVEEKAELNSLFDQLKETNAGTDRRKELIDEINSKYGTTLQNLSDEKDFALQVAAAYEQVSAQLEKKLKMELMQEDLKALYKDQIELQKKLDDARKGTGTNLLGFDTKLDPNTQKMLIDSYSEALDIVNKDIADVMKFGMGNDGAVSGLGGAGKLGSKEVTTEIENTASGIGNVNKELKNLIDTSNFGTRQRKLGVDLSQFDPKQTPVEDSMLSIYKSYADAQKKIFDDAEAQRIKEEEAMEARLKSIVESIHNTVKETLTMISDMMQSNISMIDNQIAAQQNALQQSMTREQELRDIARERKLDATESIEAERDAQKKALAEIEKLEAKKRELEMMIAAMQLLSQGKSVSDIKGSLGEIKSFIEGSFYEGTPYTIADALGRTGTRDGHIVRVDDNEAVLTGEQTRALGIGKGGNTTQDIVDKFGILGQSLRLSMPEGKQMLPATTHDHTLAKKLDQTNDILSTLPDKMPKYDSLFNSQVGYFEWVSRMKRKTTKTRYIPKR